MKNCSGKINLKNEVSITGHNTNRLTLIDINLPKQTSRSTTERAPLPIVAFNVEENYFDVFLHRIHTLFG